MFELRVTKTKPNKRLAATTQAIAFFCDGNFMSIAAVFEAFASDFY